MVGMATPRIVLTLNDPLQAASVSDAEVRRRRYLEAVERAGGDPVPLDARTAADEQARALAAMDGLVITGGGDIDPARYGRAADGSDPPDPARDRLDAEAYGVARRRGVPVLGICRGLQAINVFEGGALVQHLEGHESAAYPSPSVTVHPITLQANTLLATTLATAGELTVNSYHHQAVAIEQLAPSLRASATAPHAEHGTLVEALESLEDERWLVGVQCHPERTETSPPVLEALWRAFVAACAARGDGEAGASG